jgi:ABC-2 type transport system permease protein
MLRDRRFRLTAVVVLPLLLAALFVGFAKRQDYERQPSVAVAADRQAWVNQGEANPHSAAHFGR